ncbi:hypothetical protein MSG28_009454 [Choristoneura fumiferana]|uniref:Uncharacterized protein n=1 Tax=Choristoneura fumiferana TaxID=7141 RepID=A0ACC0JB99_CHOFU|nr:hypothetical protein MSG28_009454 [Choristoneura fumiferana]
MVVRSPSPGTPGVLLDMLFAHAHNNFLHAHVVSMVQNALANRAHHTQYATHLLEECDLLNRLMDVYEENENKKGASPRSGLMGHALQLLRALAPLAEERASAAASAAASAPASAAATATAERWAAFAPKLHQTLQQHDTPLGGYYPSENTYEVEGMAEVETALYNMSEDPDRIKFLEMASQRMLEQLNTTWDDNDEAEEREEEPLEEEGEGEGEGEGDAGAAVREVLGTVPPWETSSEETASAGEGWAQFSADVFGNIADPFAASDTFGASDTFAANDAFAASDAFATANAFASSDAFDANAGFKSDAFADEAQRLGLWQPDEGNGCGSLPAGVAALRLAPDALSSPLADNLRTALSAMTPAAVANIVNANMPPAAPPAPPAAPPAAPDGDAPPAPAPAAHS